MRLLTISLNNVKTNNMNRTKYNRGEFDSTIAAIVGVIFAVILVFFLSMTYYPKYNVYTEKENGEAELARQSYAKQVAVQEAQAKLDSAKLLAEAEVERAKGVAQANAIIGDSLRNNETYLRYLFINNLENTKDQIIYIPTETGLPILESQRLKLNQESK